MSPARRSVRSQPRRCSGEAGVVSVGELALLMPAVFAALGFLVLAGRLATIEADVTAAARDAARAASTASSYSMAAEVADDVARAALAGQDVTCGSLRVELGDPATFVPGGEVTVAVVCRVDLRDVALPGIPGSRTVGATSTEVIDRWRSVSSEGLG